MTLSSRPVFPLWLGIIANAGVLFYAFDTKIPTRDILLLLGIVNLFCIGLGTYLPIVARKWKVITFGAGVAGIAALIFVAGSAFFAPKPKSSAESGRMVHKATPSAEAFLSGKPSDVVDKYELPKKETAEQFLNAHQSGAQASEFDALLDAPQAASEKSARRAIEKKRSPPPVPNSLDHQLTDIELPAVEPGKPRHHTRDIFDEISDEEVKAGNPRKADPAR